MRAIVVALGLCLAVAPVARADGPPNGYRRVASPLWRSLTRPHARRVQQLLRQARHHVELALRAAPGDWLTMCQRTMARARLSDEPRAHQDRMRALSRLAAVAMQRRAHLDNALRRLDAARALQPDDPEVLLATSAALALWEQPGPLWQCQAKRRDRDAIAVLQRLARVDPTHLSGEVAFQLGILHTRTGDFATAAADYARAAALALDRDAVPMMETNLAEVTMLDGDLLTALTHYERAAEASRGGRDYLLALWGEAVALDRLGEHEAAVQTARRGVQGEGGGMRVLRSDGVFFQPTHEIHYYEALGHEALAALKPAQAGAAWAAAAASWRAYLAEARRGSEWRAIADENLARVLRAQSSLSPGPSINAETLP